MIGRFVRAVLRFAAVALLLALRNAVPFRGARARPGETRAASGQTHVRSNAAPTLISWKRWMVSAAVLGIVGGAIGFLVAVSGVVSIKASAGHWSITEALLQFGKRRSVATHALGTTVPPLDDPALALRGAGHYENGCRPCHGAPDLPQPLIAQSMLPRPPYLAGSVRRHGPAELFQFVKHGIKLTGMPAWPSQRRDDEVWAMVAFLQRLPEMDADEYQRLARGPAAAVADGDAPLEDLVPDEKARRVIAQTCSRCHGADGLGRGIGAFPKIAGQRPAYLRASLDAYASGRRHSGIMGPVAAGLDAAQRRAIADYYARLRPRAPSAAAVSDADGERIATAGVPEQDIPACVSCHGPGQPRENPNYPVLAGQYAGYLALQLELFRKDNRGGTAYRRVMHEIAPRLTPAQAAAVTSYFAALPWTGTPGASGVR